MNIAAELVLVTLVMVDFEDSGELVIEGSDTVLNSVEIEDGSDFAHGR